MTNLRNVFGQVSTLRARPRVRAAAALAFAVVLGVVVPRAEATSPTGILADRVVGVASAGAGGWMVYSSGRVVPFGGAPSFGSITAPLNQPIVGIASTSDGGGYWLVASDGGIFTYGDARFLGSAGRLRLNRPIVGIASSPDGRGYWLVASDGGIFTYGDARFLGSAGNLTLNRPIVGMTSTPDGRGYWQVASDGGIFTYGDARFLGSAGNLTLRQPIVGIAPTPDSRGYWLAASDGGIFTYGDARYLGSAHLPDIAAISPTGLGGYVLASRSGTEATLGPTASLTDVSPPGSGTTTPTTPTAPTTTPTVPTVVGVGGTGSAPLAIRVSGTQFVNQNGQVVHLRGVNRPGTEYACVQSLGFTSSDSGTAGQSLSYADTAVHSLLSWNRAGATTNAINVVRVPLNEDCWLGINGVPAAYSGLNYQAFIEREVSDLTAAGMYTVLDLHWSAPGTFVANAQDVEPNVDHSVAFWLQVATTFASNQAVMFDLFNEPRAWCYTTACQATYSTAVSVGWGCWLNGCTYTYGPNDYLPARNGYTFQIAGVQQLINVIRTAGARNVILAEGAGWANDLWNWMAYQPTDPDHNLAAELHTYTSSGQNAFNTYSLNQMISDGRLNTTYPIFLGEYGESICSGTTNGFTQDTINWAESQNIGWTAWGWDQGEGCGGPSLVTNDALGTPDAYGTIVQTNLRNYES